MTDQPNVTDQAIAAAPVWVRLIPKSGPHAIIRGVSRAEIAPKAIVKYHGTYYVYDTFSSTNSILSYSEEDAPLDLTPEGKV